MNHLYVKYIRFFSLLNACECMYKVQYRELKQIKTGSQQVETKNT